MKITPRQRIFDANDRQAAANADIFAGAGLTVINILASPGAGKTSVISRLLQGLPADLMRAVIEGDVASSVDTDKIRALGFPAWQINTGGGCHLDASMVARAMENLGVAGPGFLFIENIGNLICPTGFDLGENARVVIASVPEGDDKPIKYPGIFAAADAIILNKIDIMEHFDFRLDLFLAAVRAVNDKAQVLQMSAKTGQGVQAVIDWLMALRR